MRTMLAPLMRLPLLAGLAACGSGDPPAHSAAQDADSSAVAALTSPPRPPAHGAATPLSAAAAPDRTAAAASVMPPPPVPAPTRVVNPLTGMPLSLEEMHWSLEQAHLEEQLQASLLNRRKFELEREHLDANGGTPDLASGGMPMLQVPGSGVAAPGGRADGTAGRPPGGQPAMTAGPASPQEAPRRRAPTLQRTAPAVASPDRWTVVGVRAQGSAWCLLFMDGEQLSPACAGDTRQGHHVDAVSAQGYTVDGHAFSVNIPVARVRRAGAASVPPEGDPSTAAGDAGEPVAADGPALVAGLPAPDRWPVPAGSDVSKHGPRSLVSSQAQPH
jgi:hypothetical protein